MFAGGQNTVMQARGSVELVLQFEVLLFGEFLSKHTAIVTLLRPSAPMRVI